MVVALGKEGNIGVPPRILIGNITVHQQHESQGSRAVPNRQAVKGHGIVIGIGEKTERCFLDSPSPREGSRYNRRKFRNFDTARISPRNFPVRRRSPPLGADPAFNGYRGCQDYAGVPPRLYHERPRYDTPNSVGSDDRRRFFIRRDRGYYGYLQSMAFTKYPRCGRRRFHSPLSPI